MFHGSPQFLPVHAMPLHIAWHNCGSCLEGDVVALGLSFDVFCLFHCKYRKRGSIVKGCSKKVLMRTMLSPSWVVNRSWQMLRLSSTSVPWDVWLLPAASCSVRTCSIAYLFAGSDGAIH